MKPVNVQTVRDRINLLETAQAETGLLSLAGEFELACLRKLLASLEAQPVAQFADSFIFNLRGQPNGDRWPVGTKLYTVPPVKPDDLDAKRIAFITSLADDTAPQQFQALAGRACERCGGRGWVPVLDAGHPEHGGTVECPGCRKHGQ